MNTGLGSPYGSWHSVQSQGFGGFLDLASVVMESTGPALKILNGVLTHFYAQPPEVLSVENERGSTFMGR